MDANVSTELCGMQISGSVLFRNLALVTITDARIRMKNLINGIVMYGKYATVIF